VDRKNIAPVMRAGKGYGLRINRILQHRLDIYKNGCCEFLAFTSCAASAQAQNISEAKRSSYPSFPAYIPSQVSLYRVSVLVIVLGMMNGSQVRPWRWRDADPGGGH
jgi:hypothetical protein